MNDCASTLKEKLSSLINEMSASPALFVKNPEKDFTRNRKLPFDTVVKLLISMGGSSIYKELLEAEGYNVNTATLSAFVQQRDKILPFAFEFLLHGFTESFSEIKTYKGFRLLAGDGSEIRIATNPEDSDTFCQSYKKRREYNRLHLNTLYDLCSRLYVDACVQSGQRLNECGDLARMVDRAHIKENVIVIADTNYESYNVFAHIEKKNWHYLIRVKDLGCCGILDGLSLPYTDEFDVPVQIILTRRRTKETKAKPELYRYITNKSPFDFLDLQENIFYPMSFRVVRFLITDGSYETIITNLKPSAFPPSELKVLYNKRWGIETSFRELKYTVGLINFHAKKHDYIIQEIFARMIMYNFVEMITSHVVISTSDTKHDYQVNFTIAILICRHFLRCCAGVHSPDIEALIGKNILPIRPGRKAPRHIPSKHAISFMYRVA